MLLDAIGGFLELHGIRGRVVAACSGGIDSTALLIGLKELGADVVCAHVNHHLRGEESDGDEAFVRDLCRRVDVPLEIRDGTVDPDAVRQRGLEAAARDVRHAKLHDIRESAGAQWIATAHQKNDQAETIVMRLMTGTGLAGLRGIHAVRDDGFVRPLLDVTRDDIAAFLDSRGVKARLDRMNEDPRFLRNRVRAALRDLGPAAIDNIAAVAAQAQQLWPLVEQAIDRSGVVEKSPDATRFVTWPDDSWLRQALLQREIRRLDPHSRDVSAHDLERLVSHLDSLTRVSVTKTLEMLRRDATVILRRLPQPSEPFEIAVSAGEKVFIPQINASITIEGRGATFLVRNRRPGDRFRHKKLKDFLIDRKIPAEVRDRLPVVIANGEIVWVATEERSNYQINLEREDHAGVHR